LVHDALYENYAREQSEKSRTHNLASILYSCLHMEKERRITVKNGYFKDGSFMLETIDVNGAQEYWVGFIGKNNIGFYPGAVKPTFICHPRDASLAEMLPHTEIITPVKGKGIRKIISKSVYDNMLILSPFPYYEEMHVYGKYLIMKAIMGTSTTHGREEFISGIYDQARLFSFGMSQEEIYRSINRAVEDGLESGYIENRSGDLKLRGKGLLSQKSFNEFYYPHYQRKYRTTLYDF
jgi:hypothetical protein